MPSRKSRFSASSARMAELPPTPRQNTRFAATIAAAQPGLHVGHFLFCMIMRIFHTGPYLAGKFGVVRLPRIGGIRRAGIDVDDLCRDRG